MGKYFSLMTIIENLYNYKLSLIG